MFKYSRWESLPQELREQLVYYWKQKNKNLRYIKWINSQTIWKIYNEATNIYWKVSFKDFLDWTLTDDNLRKYLWLEENEVMIYWYWDKDWLVRIYRNDNIKITDELDRRLAIDFFSWIDLWFRSGYTKSLIVNWEKIKALDALRKLESKLYKKKIKDFKEFREYVLQTPLYKDGDKDIFITDFFWGKESKATDIIQRNEERFINYTKDYRKREASWEPSLNSIFYDIDSEVDIYIVEQVKLNDLLDILNTYKTKEEKVQAFKEYARENKLNTDSVFKDWTETTTEDAYNRIVRYYLEDLEDGTSHVSKNIIKNYNKVSWISKKKSKNSIKCHITWKDWDWNRYLYKTYLNGESDLYTKEWKILKYTIIVWDNSHKLRWWFIERTKDMPEYIYKKVNWVERKYKVLGKNKDVKYSNLMEAGSTWTKSKEEVTISSIIEAYNYKFWDKISDIQKEEINSYIEDFMSNYININWLEWWFDRISRIVIDLAKWDFRSYYKLSDQFKSNKLTELVSKVKWAIDKARTKWDMLKSYYLDPTISPDEIIISSKSKLAKQLMEDFGDYPNKYAAITRYPVSDRYVSWVYKVRISDNLSKEQIVTHPEAWLDKLRLDHDWDTIMAYSIKDKKSWVLARAISHNADWNKTADEFLEMSDKEYIKYLDDKIKSWKRINTFIEAKEIDKSDIENKLISASESRAYALVGKKMISQVAAFNRTLDILNSNLTRLVDNFNWDYRIFNDLPFHEKRLTLSLLWIKPNDTYRIIQDNLLKNRIKNKIGWWELKIYSWRRLIWLEDINKSFENLTEQYYTWDNKTANKAKGKLDKMIKQIEENADDIANIYYYDISDIIKDNKQWIKNIINKYDEWYYEMTWENINLAVDFGNSGKTHFPEDWATKVIKYLNNDAYVEWVEDSITELATKYQSDYWITDLEWFNNKYHISWIKRDLIEYYYSNLWSIEQIFSVNNDLWFMFAYLYKNDKEWFFQIYDYILWRRDRLPKVDWVQWKLIKQWADYTKLLYKTYLDKLDKKWVRDYILWKDSPLSEPIKSLILKLEDWLENNKWLSQVINAFKRMPLSDKVSELDLIYTSLYIKTLSKEEFSAIKNLNNWNVVSYWDLFSEKLIQDYVVFAADRNDKLFNFLSNKEFSETLTEERKAIELEKQIRKWDIDIETHNKVVEEKYNKLKEELEKRYKEWLSEIEKKYKELNDKKIEEFEKIKKLKLSSIDKEIKKINSRNKKLDGDIELLTKEIDELNKKIIHNKDFIKSNKKTRWRIQREKLISELEWKIKKIEANLVKINKEKEWLNKTLELLNKDKSNLDKISVIKKDIKEIELKLKDNKIDNLSNIFYKNEDKILELKSDKEAITKKLNNYISKITNKRKDLNNLIDTISTNKKEINDIDNLLIKRDEWLIDISNEELKSYDKLLTQKEKLINKYNREHKSIKEQLKQSTEEKAIRMVNNIRSSIETEFNKDAIKEIFPEWNNEISDEVYNELKWIRDTFKNFARWVYIDELKEKDRELVDVINTVSHSFWTDQLLVVFERTSWNKISKTVSDILKWKDKVWKLESRFPNILLYRTRTIKYEEWQKWIEKSIKNALDRSVTTDWEKYIFQWDKFKDKLLLSLKEKFKDVLDYKKLSKEEKELFQKYFKDLPYDKYTKWHLYFALLENSQKLDIVLWNYKTKLVPKLLDKLTNLRNNLDSWYEILKHYTTSKWLETNLFDDIIWGIKWDHNIAINILWISDEINFVERLMKKWFSESKAQLLYTKIFKEYQHKETFIYDILNYISYTIRYWAWNITHWAWTLAWLQQWPWQATEILTRKASFGVWDKDLDLILNKYKILFDEDTNVYASWIALENSWTNYVTAVTNWIIDRAFLTNEKAWELLKSWLDFATNPLAKHDAVFDLMRKRAWLSNAMELNWYKTIEDLEEWILLYGRKEINRIQSDARMFYNELGWWVSSKDILFKLNKVFVHNVYREQDKNIVWILLRAWDKLWGYLTSWWVNKLIRFAELFPRLLYAASKWDLTAMRQVGKEIEARARNFWALFIYSMKLQNYAEIIDWNKTDENKIVEMLHNDLVWFHTIMSPIIKTYEQSVANNAWVSTTAWLFVYNILNRFFNQPTNVSTLVSNIFNEYKLTADKWEWTFEKLSKLISSIYNWISKSGWASVRFNSFINEEANNVFKWLDVPSVLWYWYHWIENEITNRMWNIYANQSIYNSIKDWDILWIITWLFGKKNSSIEWKKIREITKDVETFIHNNKYLINTEKTDSLFQSINPLITNKDYFKDWFKEDEIKEFINFLKTGEWKIEGTEVTQNVVNVIEKTDRYLNMFKYDKDLDKLWTTEKDYYNSLWINTDIAKEYQSYFNDYDDYKKNWWKLNIWAFIREYKLRNSDEPLNLPYVNAVLYNREYKRLRKKYLDSKWLNWRAIKEDNKNNIDRHYDDSYLTYAEKLRLKFFAQENIYKELKRDTHYTDIIKSELVINNDKLQKSIKEKSWYYFVPYNKENKQLWKYNFNAKNKYVNWVSWNNINTKLNSAIQKMIKDSDYVRKTWKDIPDWLIPFMISDPKTKLMMLQWLSKERQHDLLSAYMITTEYSKSKKDALNNIWLWKIIKETKSDKDWINYFYKINKDDELLKPDSVSNKTRRQFLPNFKSSYYKKPHIKKRYDSNWWYRWFSKPMKQYINQVIQEWRWKLEENPTRYIMKKYPAAYQKFIPTWTFKLQLEDYITKHRVAETTYNKTLIKETWLWLTKIPKEFIRYFRTKKQKHMKPVKTDNIKTKYIKWRKSESVIKNLPFNFN